MKRDRGRRPKRQAGGSRAPTDRLRGPWYILWGARGLVGGILLGTIAAVALLIGSCNTRYARVAPPGNVDVRLPAGTYSIFYEFPEYLQPRPEVEFTLRSRETGETLEFLPPRHSERQTVWTRRLIVLYDVAIERDGLYELAVSYAPNSRTGDVAVAIGLGPDERLARFLWIVAVSVVGGVTFVIVAILISRYFHPRRR